MAKTALSNLAPIMPSKGEASRGEDLPQILSARVEPRTKDKETRDGLTIRVLRSDSLRLREMAYKEDRPKQALLDQAIGEFLDRHGY